MPTYQKYHKINQLSLKRPAKNPIMKTMISRAGNIRNLFHNIKAKNLQEEMKDAELNAAREQEAADDQLILKL